MRVTPTSTSRPPGASSRRTSLSTATSTRFLQSPKMVSRSTFRRTKNTQRHRRGHREEVPYDSDACGQVQQVSPEDRRVARTQQSKHQKEDNNEHYQENLVRGDCRRYGCLPYRVQRRWHVHRSVLHIGRTQGRSYRPVCCSHGQRNRLRLRQRDEELKNTQRATGRESNW